MGMPHQYIRQLYIAVCLPKMLYACDIFCANKILCPDAKSSLIPQLARVQRLAAIQIREAMPLSPADSLDIHADLLPMKHTVRKFSHRVVLHIVVQPETHPLHDPVHQAAKRYVKLHHSPLHELTAAFWIIPDQIKTVTLARISLDHIFPFNTSLNKGPAELDLQVNPANTGANPVFIYSDGLGIYQQIGSAAVIQSKAMHCGTRHYHLGPSWHHTVYEGEVVGLLLALEFIRYNRINQLVVIRLDNQAVIQALTLCHHSPSHYLIDYFHSQIQDLKAKPQHSNLQIQIEWVQGHNGKAGNEAVDGEAEKAVRGKQSIPNQLPRQLGDPLPIHILVARQANWEKIKRQIQLDFAKSPHFCKLSEIDPTVPSPQYQQMMEPQLRKISSVITQLQMGHTPLNQHLHRINRAESPTFPHA